MFLKEMAVPGRTSGINTSKKRNLGIRNSGPRIMVCNMLVCFSRSAENCDCGHQVTWVSVIWYGPMCRAWPRRRTGCFLAFSPLS